MDVRVYVTPKQGILDPQGVAVERALPADVSRELGKHRAAVLPIPGRVVVTTGDEKQLHL